MGLVRLVLTYAAVGALLILARPRQIDVALGGSCVAAGEFVRVWAAGHLRKNLELVTSGPYRHSRNPLYLGRLLIFTGLCVMARLPYAVHLLAVLPLGWLVFFGYYLPRKERVEPARLLELHGQAYTTYRREVPALWPRIRPWPGSAGRWSLGRALSNREHWMVAGLLGATAYLFWRSSP